MQPLVGMKPISHAAPLPRHRLTRRVLPLAVLVAAALGGWLIWRQLRDGPAPTTYTTVEVTQGDVTQSVTASGTLSPVVTVEVGSQTSGRIKELLVDYNDRVTKGQVIARLDPQLNEGAVAQARARLASARADLTRAEATLTNARQSYTRAVALEQGGTASRADVEAALAARRTAEASVTAAKAGITEARASVENAEANLAYTTITSPIDGVVISRSVDVGQTVAASLQAPVLFVIAEDLRKMEVHTSVAESDVGQLAAGMKVEFTVDAYPQDTFTGVVRQVRYEATTVSNVVTYDAVVEVANDALKLRPGMTANVTFVIAEARDVRTVPSKALRYRPASARRPATKTRNGGGGAGGDAPARRRAEAVWVLRDGAPARVEVTTGLSDGTTTAITGGELHAGDVVITGDSTQAPSGNGGGAANRRTGGPRPPTPF